MIPVMSSLEIVVEVIGVTALRLEKIRLQHSSYLGLDRSMNWQHAALVIKRSHGEAGEVNGGEFNHHHEHKDDVSHSHMMSR